MLLRKAFGLLFIVWTMPSNADLQKCTAKDKTTHYFDQSDKKAKTQCTTTPTIVLKQTKKNQQQSNNLNCAGSGGIVRANGKTFHLDAAELCRRYGFKGNGKIKKPSAARHVKLNHINKAFRQQFAAMINKTAKQYQLDPAFIHAIISAESAYKPNATSPAGAMGLMQLMPMTAKRFNVQNAYDPVQNIKAGVRYLRLLFNEFGTLELAAASYNAGEGSIRKYNRTIPPYKETMAYVPKVMAFYKKYKNNRQLINP